MSIDTVEDLRGHVELAVKVELTTIPLYLYAMYSIEDRDSEAAGLIASVVVEEMLHAALASNLLLSIGGEPRFDESVIPTYPCDLPHHAPAVQLDLRRCTPELIRDVFMLIESPAPAGALPQDDGFTTLGQFYASLIAGIDRLDDGSLFADPQLDRQLADPAFYAPIAFDADDSGGLMGISDRAGADRAIEIIVDQGEGLADHKWADPAHRELTHYYKFKQIADGDEPIGNVFPVATNPSIDDFPEHLESVGTLFNAIYRLTFVAMDSLFSPNVDQAAMVGRLYGLMSTCLAPVAGYLVRQRIGESLNAGPPFGVYRFREDPWREASDLARTVAEQHPSLEPVASQLASWLR